MKKVNNSEQSAQNSKETLLCLKAIQSLIKSKTYRELGLEKLNEMDVGKLSPEHLVSYHYLNGRYYIYCFRDENDVEHLEWANDFFDDMVSIAYDKNVKIDDMKLSFSIAYTKFKLAELIWDEERKPWLLKKARHITETSLKFHPDNSSFLWLQQQLVA